MNSINREDLSTMIGISNELSSKFQFPQIDAKADTYWNAYDQQKLFSSILCEYSAETPVELMNQLKQMWEFQGCSYMEGYVRPLTIAAFKNKASDEEDIEISPYIYEF